MEMGVIIFKSWTGTCHHRHTYIYICYIYYMYYLSRYLVATARVAKLEFLITALTAFGNGLYRRGDRKLKAKTGQCC
jgi:hypothetical protein